MGNWDLEAWPQRKETKRLANDSEIPLPRPRAYDFLQKPASRTQGPASPGFLRPPRCPGPGPERPRSRHLGGGRGGGGTLSRFFLNLEAY